MAVNPQNLKRFPRTYSTANFTGIATADVVCQPAMWTKVGYVTVSAQTLAAWGANTAVAGTASGEACYLRFDTSAAVQLHGLVRLAVANATETQVEVVKEERTNRLSNSTSGDRSIAPLLPESPIKAKEDSKLIIYFYPDSATAVTINYNATNTAILLPVTIYQ